MICPVCKKQHLRIIRMSDAQVMTKNETEICVNRECAFFIDLNRVKGWVASPGQTRL